MKYPVKWLMAVLVALTLALAPANGTELAAQVPAQPCDVTCVHVPDPAILVCTLVATIIVIGEDGSVTIIDIYVCTQE